jgi:hypothetical protein
LRKLPPVRTTRVQHQRDELSCSSAAKGSWNTGNTGHSNRGSRSSSRIGIVAVSVPISSEAVRGVLVQSAKVAAAEVTDPTANSAEAPDMSATKAAHVGAAPKTSHVAAAPKASHMGATTEAPAVTAATAAATGLSRGRQRLKASRAVANIVIIRFIMTLLSVIVRRGVARAQRVMPQPNIGSVTDRRDRQGIH